ncbi:ribonuclease Z [Seleniivibrio sp.]|uniref:ribonuclease Z n=1 Tax=Seleniivibrio sp. TaxID=2898801 RepID=UPI0025D999F9|nr:ribonuclease Z [Seleniivibrio sp.]MCD8552798.1 ribonuclease Z [Seleniivibrio sp.]
MKHNFDIKQVNSPFEDTSFFVRNVYKTEGFLFDCGKLGGLTNSEVLAISEIFISHTHIDHFYGFDRILRGTLLSGKRFRVFGPQGIIKNVRGKIDAYTWNLIKSYPVSYEVVELNSEKKEYETAVFSAADGFEMVKGSVKHDDIILGDGFRLDFDIFDHRVPSVGYRVTEREMVAVKKDALDDGFLSGRWIGELKRRVLADQLEGEIEAESKDGTVRMTIREAKDRFIEHVKPKSVTFITDIAPSEENYEKAVALAKDTSVLLIECVFLEEDAEHADIKKHLTMTLSKKIFRESGAEKVRFFHFAPRYDQNRKEFFDRLYSDMDGSIY